MQELHISWQNISAGHGWSVCATGISIVFMSLAGVSLFIAALPKALSVLNKIVPEAVEPAPKPRAARGANDEAIAVAAAVACHNG